MDCCNYVQPYNSGTGHFYHQQNHFYYENMNAYASYSGSMTPGSNAIETNVRYNRLPPAYPTDYVYNPKEARLRKAMREQSRELSRQSILQTAIASAASSSGNGSGSGAVTSSSFPNHPLSCSSSSTGGTVSPLQNGSPSVNSGRIINPWFPVGPASSSAHLKPIISPRMMAAHQRTLEKTKEAMRKQVECSASGVFSSGGAANPSSGSGYPGEFGGHNSPTTSANDYCIIAEFGEGQKWHPYQNGGNPYHGRGAAMPKVGLHPNANVHGPWAQFCGLPLQTSAVQNPVIRPSRQMVFLQDQQSQHCNAFSDEMQMSYVQAKMEPNHRLHLAYSGQRDPQVKASVSPPQIQQQQHQQHHHHQQQLQHEESKCGEASQGWDSESTAGSSGVTGVPNMIQDQGAQDQEEEGGQQVSEIQEEPTRQKPSSNKQPLPGFHQAFGSTEIGRFSRSEFFANMVGDSSNVSSTRGNHPRQVSLDCDLKSTATGRPSPAFFNSQQSNQQTVGVVTCNGPGVSSFGNINNFGNVALAAYYNDIRSPATPVVANPRWHSPYVGVIGSEI
ncbi:serine/threonine-protein kinase Warts-like isoform X1 [Diprion similis]|uniref:serine/threonine-protein kinase Warts-like isoform X1 n=1 Tax=Diprion similis TaxID=362088 RepID=UPI001EF83479|nr:serine/threonine-protein kinase Warts-like isoform X1 [Diprion similis]